MAMIPVIIKHAGKRYDVEIDPDSTGEDFKAAVFSLTGVEPERQKIFVKGGQLKDDQDMSLLGAKSGQTFMMMGTASGTGPSMERPKEKPRFVEDMSEAQLAQSEFATPAGLQNLGNTCYMNSTLQALKAIPELQQELKLYKPSSTGTGQSDFNLATFGMAGLGSANDLTASLRDLYKQMSETQIGFPPLMFLNAFRTTYPQFAERTNTPHGQAYAQQDAEEAWSQLVTTLRAKLMIDEKSKITEDASSSSTGTSFIDKYMSGKFRTVTTCDDDAATEANEEAVVNEEPFYKLSCHISQSVNHLRDGLTAGLTDEYDKKSEALGREAHYTKVSRISRLPQYLPIHFVRFFWRRDINKKTKILKKVSFQHELDCVEYCTDELKSKLIPVRDKMRDLRKEEIDVERARKRQRLMEKAAEASKSDTGEKSKNKSSSKDEKKDGDADMGDVEYKTDAQIEAEREAQILNAKKELLAAVNPDIAADAGANQTGLYELRAVITHQGASSDSGHYIAFVKKEGKVDPVTGKKGAEDGGWWQFNDEKVTEVDSEKIETLAGGGESASALILLYRAVELPTIEKEM